MSRVNLLLDWGDDITNKVKEEDEDEDEDCNGD